MPPLGSIFSCRHVWGRSAGILQQDTPLAEWSAPRVKSDLSGYAFFQTLFTIFFWAVNRHNRFPLFWINAAMTREEDLIRIAKKLDKMVSRNNTVSLYFDNHRWRVILPPRVVQEARERLRTKWNVLLQIKVEEKALTWVECVFGRFCMAVTWSWRCCNKRSTGVWHMFAHISLAGREVLSESAETHGSSFVSLSTRLCESLAGGHIEFDP